MVIDKVNGQKRPRYLVYDIIRYENEDVGKKPFDPDRLVYIERRIIGESCIKFIILQSLSAVWTNSQYAI